MSRSNRVKPAGVNNAHNEDKMFAEQGPNLKALKLVCVGLGVSTIIITAVFGGLIYHLVSSFFSLP